ncbi:MAG: hypothetical protein EOO10_19870, partial [Chitinophagaceae bacterium]
MKNNKTASRKGQKKRGITTLTKSDLTKIRSFLPFNWRQQIAETHEGLSLRQISEVFHQRTSEPVSNVLVWTAINKVLVNGGKEKLAEKVQKHLFLFSSLYN